MNSVEDRFALMRCSSVSPSTAFLRLLQIGNESQGELAAPLLCLAAARWRGCVALMKQRTRSFRDGQEAGSRLAAAVIVTPPSRPSRAYLPASLYLDQRREPVEIGTKPLRDLS